MSETRILLAYKDKEGNYQGEAVWAAKEGEYYRIRNIPFYAENVSLNDLISAEREEGVLYFGKLIESSGHSVVTMRISKVKEVALVGKELVALGCRWEGGTRKNLIAVDIPKEVSYAKIRKWLEKGVKEKRWDYKELSLSHEE